MRGCGYYKVLVTGQSTPTYSCLAFARTRFNDGVADESYLPDVDDHEVAPSAGGVQGERGRASPRLLRESNQA